MDGQAILIAAAVGLTLYAGEKTYEAGKWIVRKVDHAIIHRHPAKPTVAVQPQK